MKKKSFLAKYYPEFGLMGFKILDKNMYPCIWENPDGKIYKIVNTKNGLDVMN